MTDTPLITVIIPVYNVEKYLDACMESVTAQTYKNLEIILVDDGAKDRSGGMCDAWADKDSRIRVIHQENRGLSGARNTGLDHASGEYVMFVDSDDILSPELCRRLYEAAAEGADVAVCDAVHIFGDKPYEFLTVGERESMEPDEAIRRMWYQTAFLPSAWGKLYRAKLFSTRRFTEKRLFEDIDLMHEVLYDANRVVYDHSRLYGYVHRDDSITTKAFSMRDLDILIIADKILDFVQDKPGLEKAAQAYAVTAALRVFMNAPGTGEFADGIAKAVSMIQSMGKAVMKDPDIRRKNYLALRLYFFSKPLMRTAYKFVNRWK